MKQKNQDGSKTNAIILNHVKNRAFILVVSSFLVSKEFEFGFIEQISSLHVY